MALPLKTRVVVSALVVAGLLLGTRDTVRAQTLTFAYFQLYLEQLRVDAGIPGLSAIIVQDGQPVWERGLGLRDVEAALPALPDTPYPVADLTQLFTATLLLNCVERGELDLDNPIGNWLPLAERPGSTLYQLLSHHAVGPSNAFRYQPARFALLTAPIESCHDTGFRTVLEDTILTRRAMHDSVPGYDIATAPSDVRDQFDPSTLERYERALRRMATPYRVDRRGRATRSELPPAAVDGTHGLITSARDLAKFDAALDDDMFLRADMRARSRSNAVHGNIVSPAGLGWFVQTVNGERVVWQFSHSADAFSSLVLKVPARRITLILLANSDGLSAPYSLQEGDVTTSHFARTFLHLFI